MSTQSAYTYIPQSETEIYYPKSKRKVKLDSKGNVISDTANNKKVKYDSKGDVISDSSNNKLH